MKFRAQIVLTQAYQFNNKVCYVRVSVFTKGDVENKLYQ